MAQRKSKKETSGVAASGGTLALPTITRAKAQELLHARAVELYHDAKSRQQDGIARFESQYGRADRIDSTPLRELQHLQMRFAAIAARQLRSAYSQEPKVRQIRQIPGRDHRRLLRISASLEAA